MCKFQLFYSFPFSFFYHFIAFLCNHFLQSIIYILMQNPHTYNFIVLGRVGTGKSALTRYLTGREDCPSSSQKKSHTKNTKMYTSSHENEQKDYIINVIDTPGLDENNIQQFSVRQQILKSLNNLELNGILYLVQLRGRDNESIQKILRFIRNLPYSHDKLMKSIIPVITFYDQIILMDLDNQEINEHQNQWCKQFIEVGMQQVWNNRMSWINPTKKIEKHLKNPEISSIYSNQISKLLNKTKDIKLKYDFEKYEKEMMKRIGELIKQLQLTQELGKSSIEITQDWQFQIKENTFKEELKVIPKIFSEFKQFYVSQDITIKQKMLYSPIMIGYLALLTLLEPCRVIYDYFTVAYRISINNHSIQQENYKKYEQLLKSIVIRQIVDNDIISIIQKKNHILIQFNAQKMKSICKFTKIQMEYTQIQDYQMNILQQNFNSINISDQNNFKAPISLIRDNKIQGVYRLRWRLVCTLTRVDQLNKFIEDNYYQKINKYILFD